MIVSLITRFLSRQLSYINVAKKYIEIRDFFEILDRIIYTPESHGQLGGKGAGLFLAQQIIKKSYGTDPLFANVKVPKSWYITSDVLLGFLRYNNLDEVIEQKYKDINQVRLEYPHVMLTFKNSRFPPEIVQGLSMVLDELEGMPLIIRSSSLLEDSLGAAFSGKYKSLFLANQGTKQERLDALLDAIAEVYASTFGPDPIEYRAERGLLDFNEEMGIMIQGVVGTRVGDYFLPAFAGVAFSRNEFRWSPRIKREDGLIRTVPGLGTRAVDRVSDDYPVLIAPGQPGLRVNVATEEIVYYSPKKIDVINLKTNTFETMDAKDLLRKHGAELPLVEKMVSIYDGHNLRKPMAMNIDFEKDDLPFTLDGLIGETPFVKQVHGILKLLEEKLGFPVDIEFAHDGTDFYLLQCRPQSFSPASAPAPIPQDIPGREDRLLGEALHLERARSGHHPHRLRRSAHVRRASGAGRPRRRGTRRRTSQQASSEAAVHPHGARPMGKPRRHQARRERHLLRHQQHRRPHRDRPQEGQLHAGPLLRHALLPGSRRGADTLPSPLPRRRGDRLQRALPPRFAEHSRPRSCPNSPGSPTSCGSSTSRRRPAARSSGF